MITNKNRINILKYKNISKYEYLYKEYMNVMNDKYLYIYIYQIVYDYQIINFSYFMFFFKFY